MALSKEEIYRLAALARVDVEEQDLPVVQDRLERVLAYVDRLARISTKDVPETEDDGLARPLRQDTAIPVDDVTRNLIISNFPDRVGDALRVPAVFENPKG